MRHYLHIIIEWISGVTMIFCIFMGLLKWPKENLEAVVVFSIFLGIWLLNNFFFKKWSFNKMKKIFRQGG